MSLWSRGSAWAKVASKTNECAVFDRTTHRVGIQPKWASNRNVRANIHLERPSKIE
jgi:hypothetical protein